MESVAWKSLQSVVKLGGMYVQYLRTRLARVLC